MLSACLFLPYCALHLKGGAQAPLFQQVLFITQRVLYTQDADAAVDTYAGSLTSRNSLRARSRRQSGASSNDSRQQQGGAPQGRQLDQQQQLLRQYQQHGYEHQQWVYQQQQEAAYEQEEGSEGGVPLWWVLGLGLQPDACQAH